MSLDKGHLWYLSTLDKKTFNSSRKSNHGSLQSRKLLRLEEHRQTTGKDGQFHTVAFDHRQAFRDGDLNKAQTFPAYYKRGAGSFALSDMEPVGSPEELNRLMSVPDADLPEKARPTTRGFWGRYNATKDKRKREKMLKDALKKEKANANGGKPT